MTPIKVLHAITDMGVGGAERVVLALAQDTENEAVSSSVVAFTEDATGIAIYGGQDIAFRQIAIRTPRALRLDRLAQYVALLRDMKPDVIHAHMFHALALTQIAMAFAPCKPKLVFTSHIAAIPAARRAWISATRRTRAADIIFDEGQHPELNAARTVVIENGVEVPAQVQRPPRRAGDPVRFIFVGRLAEQKDPIGLLDAFAAAGVENSSLEMVGHGDLAKALEARIAELGLGGRVILSGLHADVRQRLRQADGFLLHSRYEGLPIALLEAGAEALPILSTPVGSIPSLLGDGHGYIAAPSDFPDGIRQLAQSPEDARNRGLRLRARIQDQYSVASMTKAHLALYRSVLSTT